jgi:hypothetical protein
MALRRIAVALWVGLSTIFSENRFALIRIMLELQQQIDHASPSMLLIP